MTSKKFYLSVTKDPFDNLKTICLVGKCYQCNDKLGNNNLIIYDFKANKINRAESIFKTICLKCNLKSFVALKDVDAESSKDFDD